MTYDAKKTYHNVFLAIFFYSGSQPILVRFWLAAATYFKGLEVFMINTYIPRYPNHGDTVCKNRRF